MTRHYLEDFEAGQRFGGAERIRIEKDRIVAFAAEFDPQTFHLDEAAASGSVFRGLTASGWHTAAVTMRLLVESDLKPAGASWGQGSTNSAGRGLCGPEMSCAWRARCSKCARRSRGRTRG
jgi:acyl dehydratase